jgi:ferredoxin
MAAVRAMLAEASFDMARYHEESFTFESPAVDEADAPTVADETQPAGAEAQRFAITLKSRGERFECGADETLLKAAQRAGIRWPFSCSSGVCGTCRTRKLAGEVQMNQGGGLRPREVAQGWMLPCCSKPLSDIELDR